jgi:hypothetical protein
VDHLTSLIAARLSVLRRIAEISPEGAARQPFTDDARLDAVDAMRRVAQALQHICLVERRRLDERRLALSRAATLTMAGIALGGALLSASAILILCLLHLRRAAGGMKTASWSSTGSWSSGCRSRPPGCNAP